MNRIEIPMKLPSLNEYIKDCRANKYAGAKTKKRLEDDLAIFISRLPEFKNPIKIHFTWVESNKRRDLDNISYAKKFILDVMVKTGKLKDDNRKYVTGFIDDFIYSDETKVILEIEEVDSGRN